MRPISALEESTGYQEKKLCEESMAEQGGKGPNRRMNRMLPEQGGGGLLCCSGSTPCLGPARGASACQGGQCLLCGAVKQLGSKKTSAGCMETLVRVVHC
jgi:hypothetical protein